MKDFLIEYVHHLNRASYFKLHDSKYLVCQFRASLLLFLYKFIENNYLDQTQQSIVMWVFWRKRKDYQCCAITKEEMLANRDNNWNILIPNMIHI